VIAVGDRLRVALDATPLLGRPTGVGAFCAGALSGLAARDDVEVEAFAISWRRRHGIVSLVPAGVAVSQRAMPARPLHRMWRRSDFPALEWFVGHPEVVHGTNFVVPPTRRAARVVTVHDLTMVRYPELCDAGALAFPALLRRALSEGAWVHTPSASVAAEVVEAFGVSPERVRAVHSGVPPLPEPDPAAAAHARRLLPEGAERYLLAVGTFEPRKDLPTLVAAFGEVAADRSDLALVLAGQPGWGAVPLQQAIERSAVGHRVVRTGWIDEPVLAALLRGAALLAYPSIYEGFGFPPLQAMSEGVPVVATRAGALPEVLEDAAVLVPPRDPGALAAALAEVLDRADRRQDLVTRGRRRAAAFSWDRCAEGLMALYRASAAERARR
jgi:glycosyltransferase involved in cell wall biosynthesis